MGTPGVVQHGRAVWKRWEEALAPGKMLLMQECQAYWLWHLRWRNGERGV